MANEKSVGLSEQEILAIYAPAAKAGKTWAEIMQLFPGYNQNTLMVRISNIRTKRSEGLTAAVTAKREAGVKISNEDYEKLEAKLVDDVVPKIQKRAGRGGKGNSFANEFDAAFEALAALTGEQDAKTVDTLEDAVNQLDTESA